MSTTSLRRGLCTLALITAALWAPGAQAQVEISTGLYYGSPNVFRGALFSTGFVFQPTVSVGYRGFSAGFFGNIDPSSATTSTGQKIAFNEADLFAGYETTIGPATAGLTYTYYTFPIPTGDKLELAPTQEVALALGLDVPLSPGALLVYDFDGSADDLRGFYGEVSLTHPLSISGQAVSLTGILAMDGGYLLPNDRFAVVHTTFQLATDFALGRATLSPLVALQISVDDAYRNAFARPTVFYGGLNISF